MEDVLFRHGKLSQIKVDFIRVISAPVDSSKGISSIFREALQKIGLDFDHFEMLEARLITSEGGTIGTLWFKFAEGWMTRSD